MIHISSTQVRNVYNTWVPGCVDANGQLDTQYPGVQEMTEGFMGLPANIGSIEGLEAFTAMTRLNVSGGTTSTDISGFPPNLVHLDFGIRSASMPALPAGLEYFEVLGPVNGGLLSIPQLPAGLDTLFLNQLNQIAELQPLPPGLSYLHLRSMEELTALPPLPASLTLLKLDNLPLVPSLPTLPDGLIRLEVWGMELITGVPELPSTLRQLFLGGLNTLAVVPALNAGLLELFLGTLPAISAVPEFPTSLRWLQMEHLDIAQVPEMINTELDSLFLNDLINVTELPPVPGTMDLCKLYVLTSLTQIAALPANVAYLDLELLPAITELPPLPVVGQFIRLIWLDGIQQLSDLPADLETFAIGNMPGLQCLPMLPDGLDVLHVSNCPGITCLPNHPSTLTDYYIAPLTWTMVCTGLNSVCPSTNGAVRGKVYHDVDGDGQWSGNESGLPFSTVTAQPSGLMFGCDIQGVFDQAINPGAHTLTAQPSVPYTMAISPWEHTANIADNTTLDEGNDFGATLQAGVHDLRIDLATAQPRSGWTNLVWITCQNVGTVVQDAVITLHGDGDQIFGSSDVGPVSIDGGTIVWNVDDLDIGEVVVITVNMNTPGSVLQGEQVFQLATVTPDGNDAAIVNNSASTNTAVVASFDPNDKQVEPSEIPYLGWSEAEVTYTIRFQNTGTAPADRVIITDTLSADLDASTFRFVSSSHPCTWFLLDHVLRFTFEGINLPDSTSDEAGSHGFVRFTIDPVDLPASLPIGNTAAIYFDFNEPVVTNTALLDMSTGISELEGPEMILYPNPVSGQLFVSGLGVRSGVFNAEILDVNGRRVLSERVGGPSTRLDVSSLESGMYVLRVLDGGRLSRCFIKH